MFDKAGKELEDKVEANDGDNQMLRMLAEKAFAAYKRRNQDTSEQAFLPKSEQSSLDRLDLEPLPATSTGPMSQDCASYIVSILGQRVDTNAPPAISAVNSSGSEPWDHNGGNLPTTETRDPYEDVLPSTTNKTTVSNTMKSKASSSVFKKSKSKAPGSKKRHQQISRNKPRVKHTAGKPAAVSSTTVITEETEDPSEPCSHDFSSLPTSSSDTDEYVDEGGYTATSLPATTKSPVSQKKPEASAKKKSKSSKTQIKKKKQQQKTSIPRAKTMATKSKNRMNGRNLFSSLLIKYYKLLLNEEEALALTRGTSCQCMLDRALMLLRETPEEKKVRARAESGDRKRKPLRKLSKLHGKKKTPSLIMQKTLLST